MQIFKILKGEITMTKNTNISLLTPIRYLDVKFYWSCSNTCIEMYLKAFWMPSILFKNLHLLSLLMYCKLYSFRRSICSLSQFLLFEKKVCYLIQCHTFKKFLLQNLKTFYMRIYSSIFIKRSLFSHQGHCITLEFCRAKVFLYAISQTPSLVSQTPILKPKRLI